MVPYPNNFLWITASAATVNPNGIKMHLVQGLIACPSKGYPDFSNGPKSLPKNPPDCPILRKWVFDYFTQAEELFAKTLRSFKICVLVNNNLCRKLFSSLESPIIFVEIFKGTSLFNPDVKTK